MFASVSHPSLEKFDALIKQAIQCITNSDFSSLQWIKASLPVKDGGVGVRRVSSLALPVFFASAANTLSAQDDILTDCVQSESDFFLQSYLAVWSAVFQSFWPPTFPFSQPSKTEYFTVSLQHIWHSGFLSRRSDGLELTV